MRFQRGSTLINRLIKKNKSMWDIFENRADKNTCLAKSYRNFLIDKAKLISIEKKANERKEMGTLH